MLLNAVPGPLLAWVNKWLALLDHLTLFSNPSWLAADRNAAALSVPAVLLVALLCQHQGRVPLLRALRRAVTAVATGLLLCAGIRLFLSLPPARPELDDALGMVWETLYVLTIMTITVSITIALLIPPATANS